MGRTWRRHKGLRGTAAARSLGSPGDWQAAQNRMCRDKKSFPSRVKGEAAARLIGESGPPMRTYECPLCSKWHLTTQPLRS